MIALQLTAAHFAKVNVTTASQSIWTHKTLKSWT